MIYGKRGFFLWFFVTAMSYGHHCPIINLREESIMESVNAKDRHGHTPLISASKEGLKDFVKDLLHRGADISTMSDKGKTALHYAAANGHTDIVKMLVEHGADADARDREGHTPLMLAAIYGCNKTVQALLDDGANPTIKTPAGNTANLYAVNNSHPLASALLKKAERAKLGNA
jgi:ankyrin repeat protein